MYHELPEDVRRRSAPRVLVPRDQQHAHTCTFWLHALSASGEYLSLMLRRKILVRISRRPGATPSSNRRKIKIGSSHPATGAGPSHSTSVGQPYHGMTFRSQGRLLQPPTEECAIRQCSVPIMQTKILGNRDLSTLASEEASPTYLPTVQDGHEHWSTSDEEFRKICKELDDKVTRFLSETYDEEGLSGLQDQIRASLRPLEEALQTYSFEELSLSYNGGKDCLVLLILYLVALHRHFTSLGAPVPTSIETIYIQTPHPFPQVTEFVETSSAYYHLRVASSALPMKEAFAEYLAQHSEVKTIFVGTRRTDPHGGKLTHFDITDGGWPRFMRCHPVIDWHYRDIWAFIRHFEIPYCSLYDQGYTSLGGTNDTSPNPALIDSRGSEGGGATQYRPAYILQADDEERLGRDK